jgi:hypothetical protein
MSDLSSSPSTPALVSRQGGRSDDTGQYLYIAPDGCLAWTSRSEAATVFTCMKEAMRMAIRLPGSLRAFGLPVAGSGWSKDSGTSSPQRP